MFIANPAIKQGNRDFPVQFSKKIKYKTIENIFLILNFLNPVFDIYTVKICKIFLKEASPRWHLFDRNWTKSSNIVKYHYNLKLQFLFISFMFHFHFNIC